jgi:excisionase family DNA binding protein
MTHDAATRERGAEVLDDAHCSPNKLALSIAELAMLSGCGRDKLYEAIRDGRLTARKFGRKTLVTTNDARTFLDNLPRLELGEK